MKPVQIVNRVWRAACRPRPAVRGVLSIRAGIRAWIEPSRLRASMVGPDVFEFLSERRHVRGAADWSRADWPLLWRYHLHYFDDLNAVDFAARAAWHHALIGRWISDNPPGSAPGWDAFPTSLRVVNWIKWWLGGAPPSAEQLESARLQLAHLNERPEYHLMGNHLLENARALVFGGLYFRGAQADGWLDRGLAILAEQVPEQVLGDGGHFERSPMYHQAVLAGLLDVYNALGVFDRPERGALAPHLRRMLRWSALMSHPDGDIALFNDAALGEAAPAAALSAYAARLGIAPLEALDRPAADVHLEASGYVRAARPAYVAILNVGSVGPRYQPGHAHADTLSFELSAGGRRMIVDCGTSTYERGARRDFERGTGAHNTVVVDDHDSSEVWSSFRVARRARVLAATLRVDAGGQAEVEAVHDGYRRLPSRALHRRLWRIGAHEMRIEDRIEGRGEAFLRLHFNVHPDFALERTSPCAFALRSADGRVTATIETPPDLDARLERWSYAPRFGELMAGTRIAAEGRAPLPAALVSVLRFAGADAPEVRS